MDCSPGGTTCLVSAWHKRQVKQSLETPNAAWQPSPQRPCERSARLVQVLPASTPVPDHSRCVGPFRRQTFFLAESGAHGSAYLHLSIHGLGSLQCGPVQRSLTSITRDSRRTADIDRAHAASLCALRCSRGPVVTPRHAPSFDESITLCMADVTVCAVRVWSVELARLSSDSAHSLQFAHIYLISRLPCDVALLRQHRP